MFRSFSSRSTLVFVAGAAALSLSAVAKATDFATYVPNSYVAGSLAPFYVDNYGSPTVLNNAPSGLTGVGTLYQGVVSVFNPVYDSDQLVEIGAGGAVTLQFPAPINVASGLSVGVFSNAGLTDNASFPPYPSADEYFPELLPSGEASTFGGGTAQVSVSSDNKTWVSLGTVTFNLPENFYENAGPYDGVAPDPAIPADFGQPFAGTLASFDDETYAQIISTLGNSAGGTWLDLSGTGLSQIQFIQFSEPADGSNFALQAVAAADPVTSVPEPASLTMLAAAGGLMLRRRSRTSPR
jgi:hypothetical protein